MSERRYFCLEFELPPYMKILPTVFDRCKASRYFLIHADENPESNEASWYARASLNEFKSALDLIGLDMKAIHLSSEWAQSSERKELKDDLAIKMLRCCRNLSFHAGSITTKTKERTLRIIGPEESRLSTFKTLFVDGMCNQVANARLKLTPDELIEISEIEDSIPLFMILAECYKILGIFLENFLLSHGKLDVAECEKFWDRHR